MKRTDEGLGKVSPERAAKPSQAPRREGAGRQRHQLPSDDSSPAAAAASRPSFSPQGSTADARSAAEAAVRKSELCTPLPLFSLLLVARAPPAPIQPAYSPHWACKAFQGIYPPVCPIWPPAQETAASLCTGTADPSAADYLLVALLFAWHFNGDAAALKGWCSDVKGTLSNLGHHSAAPWRKTLAAVMKCRNEKVLAMAAHSMSTHFGVDVPALCAVNYLKMHCKGKVLKSDAQRKQKPRMTAGDAVHFTALITAVENLTAEQRNRMAGSEGKAPTPPRPRAGGYKKKELSYEQLEELSASYKSQRDAEIASRRKADARHAEKVEALGRKLALAQASSADHQLDKMQGRLQGLEHKLGLAAKEIAMLKEQNKELNEQNARMNADVVEAHSDISKHHDAAADFADDFAARMVVKRGQKATPGFILMGMRCMLKGMSPRGFKPCINAFVAQAVPDLAERAADMEFGPKLRVGRTPIALYMSPDTRRVFHRFS